jgi:hypothetical protein
LEEEVVEVEEYSVGEYMMEVVGDSVELEEQPVPTEAWRNPNFAP